MNRTRTTMSIFGAAVLALSVTSCGDDSSEYCNVLQDTEERFADLQPDPSDAESFDEMVSALQEITDAAPDDIQSDWQTVTDTIEGMADIDPTNPDPSALEALNSEEVQTASENIETHAQEECDVSLGG